MFLIFAFKHFVLFLKFKRETIKTSHTTLFNIFYFKAKNVMLNFELILRNTVKTLGMFFRK